MPRAASQYAVPVPGPPRSLFGARWRSALGLGSVLGYLIARRRASGRSVLGLVGSESSQDIKHFAEFGVVMMLFLVGLELRSRRSLVADAQGELLGLGGLQVDAFDGSRSAARRLSALGHGRGTRAHSPWG